MSGGQSKPQAMANHNASIYQAFGYAAIGRLGSSAGALARSSPYQQQDAKPIAPATARRGSGACAAIVRALAKWQIARREKATRAPDVAPQGNWAVMVDSTPELTMPPPEEALPRTTRGETWSGEALKLGGEPSIESKVARASPKPKWQPLGRLGLSSRPRVRYASRSLPPHPSATEYRRDV